jgi:hypothetical protein
VDCADLSPSGPPFNCEFFLSPEVTRVCAATPPHQVTIGVCSGLIQLVDVNGGETRTCLYTNVGYRLVWASYSDGAPHPCQDGGTSTVLTSADAPSQIFGCGAFVGCPTDAGTD